MNGTCLAFPDTPHPATRKSGYCERHHAEYDRAISAYRSAVYNYRHGRTQKKPPSRATVVKRVKFSPIPVPTESVRRQEEAHGLLAAWRTITEWARNGRVNPRELAAIKAHLDAAIAVLDPKR